MPVVVAWPCRATSIVWGFTQGTNDLEKELVLALTLSAPGRLAGA